MSRKIAAVLTVVLLTGSAAWGAKKKSPEADLRGIEAKFYELIVPMANEVHDAYAEQYEQLRRTERMEKEVVGLYARYCMAWISIKQKEDPDWKPPYTCPFNLPNQPEEVVRARFKHCPAKLKEIENRWRSGARSRRKESISVPRE